MGSIICKSVAGKLSQQEVGEHSIIGEDNTLETMNMHLTARQIFSVHEKKIASGVLHMVWRAVPIQNNSVHKFAFKYWICW